MKWENRPIEVAYLLNPAFCTVLLLDSIRAYEKLDKKGMSYFLVFLVLPLLLHGKTRKNIPVKHKTTLFEWVKKQQITNYLLAEHIRQKQPYTKEALMFAIQQDILKFGDEEQNTGNILATTRNLHDDDIWTKSDTADEFKRKAGVIGGWFGEVGDVATIYRVLGIYP